MEKKIIKASNEGRLDKLLSDELSLSRSFVQKLCDDGKIRINGKNVKKSLNLCGGEEIEVEITKPQSLDAIPQNIPLDIVFEDDFIIVVNKPKGMVVHPAAGHYEGTLVNALLSHCGSSLSGIGGKIRPGIVHRIDKDTSGLIIAAKNDKAHLFLSEQLSDRSLSRTYDAVVYGNISDDGNVCAPIGRSLKDRKKMAVVPNGRYALTRYYAVSSCGSFSHIKCKLETGRTHQIRVHMSSIGHPVAGDILYGPKKDNTGLKGQCLHASQLKFIHPQTKEHMEFSSPLPEYFIKFLNNYGLI